MKKIIMLLIVLAGINLQAVTISDKLLDAIADVESLGESNRDTCIGDNGNAVGRYQIWKIYVDDVNRFSKVKFTYDCRKNADTSRQIVKAYLIHYGKRYERLTGKKASNEVLARIHNGGPNGYKKEATLKYWEKVQRKMK